MAVAVNNNNKKKLPTFKELFEMYERGEETWFPLVQASQILGIHRSTLRRWIAEGKLDGYHIGRAIMVKLSDLVKFIESRKITGK